MARILVLSPHPDDEAIGCGGTICKHIAEGDEVRVIFLTSGEQGGHGLGLAETSRIREAEAAAAAEILGVQQFEFWHAPDGRLKASTALVKRLADALMDWPAEVIYTTHAGEAHPDHRAAPRIVARALAVSAHQPEPITRLSEIWTPLARIDCIHDVSPWMKTKLLAVRAYASQCSVLRFDDAVAGLNRYRGEMHSWPGGDFAEVFAVANPQS
ncbi:PIG-L deacetylase family protein [Piscinibacter sakaiensis]|uniref:PIG-L deacetylase family protein n=1 Tax=Piscinibacter sakaiensis TaxID=1547922 RepID=UPI003AAC1FF9